MARLGFGAFLAPHHPIGENPTLQFRRDLKFVEHLDELGYDEFWCGEHHSSGWETIASPETGPDPSPLTMVRHLQVFCSLMAQILPRTAASTQADSLRMTKGCPRRSL